MVKIVDKKALIKLKFKKSNPKFNFITKKSRNHGTIKWYIYTPYEMRPKY
jgi:hypothetical protein